MWQFVLVYAQNCIYFLTVASTQHVVVRDVRTVFAAYSLRCYQCASLTSSSCSTNGLRNVQPTTCLPVFNACQKIRTESKLVIGFG